MENLFIFLIVLIFILQWIAKLIQRAKPQPEPGPEEILPPEVEEYFKSIGLPGGETELGPPKAIAEKKAVGPPELVKKKEVEKPVEEVKREKEPAIRRAPVLEQIPPFLIFSKETIKQGIIFSTILGPPKARRSLK